MILKQIEELEDKKKRCLHSRDGPNLFAIEEHFVDNDCLKSLDEEFNAGGCHVCPEHHINPSLLSFSHHGHWASSLHDSLDEYHDMGWGGDDGWEHQ